MLGDFELASTRHCATSPQRAVVTNDIHLGIDTRHHVSPPPRKYAARDTPQLKPVLLRSIAGCTVLKIDLQDSGDGCSGRAQDPRATPRHQTPLMSMAFSISARFPGAGAPISTRAARQRRCDKSPVSSTVERQKSRAPHKTHSGSDHFESIALSGETSPPPYVSPKHGSLEPFG